MKKDSMTAGVLSDNILDAYLENIDVNNPPAPKTVTNELVTEIRKGIKAMNLILPKDERWTLPQSLDPSQIAKIMLKLHRIYNITTVSTKGGKPNPELDMLAIYQEDGPNKGIYSSDNEAFKRIAKLYNSKLTTNGLKEIMADLKSSAERRTQCADKNLIPVNNGIFDYKNKVLMDFDADYIFTAKSATNYNPSASNITIHNDNDNTDWDVESWMRELSDNPEIVNLLWEIIGASIRPYERWNKAAFFFSEKGNNGKGTLCQLIRNLCGTNNCADIPLSEFSKEYGLADLIGKIAIVVDENDVDVYIDKVAKLKAIITNDVVTINRKYKNPISYQFFGFMIQCTNSFPKIRDRSDSFYRRQLFVPFDKCFTGHTRDYIKNDYINRPEVLEYIMYRVLNMNYDKFSEPEACASLLDEYKVFNDPIRQFTEDILPELAWDFVPFSFLYDLYKAWYIKNVGTTGLQGKNKFNIDFLNIISTNAEWDYPGKSCPITVGNRMNAPEPLIAEYNLKEWMNPNYKGNDIDKICTVIPKRQYAGIIRL